MAVNLKPPRALLAVRGVLLGSAAAGLRGRGRDDLTVVTLNDGAAVAGVFTQNRFPAPPVTLCKRHLRKGKARALAINAGIANAGTLGEGLEDAKESCRLVAALAGCRAGEVLPFSTGVIMERLPMKKYARGLKQCANNLKPDGWLRAAKAIMTTDTVAKGISRKTADGKRQYNITGIAKGAGMIHPNMATMLAFVATDAAIGVAALREWQRDIAAKTFNAISVDGDTSTNDSFVLIATGEAGKPSARAMRKLQSDIGEVCKHLAHAIVRDGEGAKKILTIRVLKGKNAEVCRRVADSVARSPLVKTALAAGDANVGRLLMATGNAGGGFAPEKVCATIGGARVIKNGGLDLQYKEQTAAKAMRKAEVELEIALNNGSASATVVTCDFTEEYIKINASYRS